MSAVIESKRIACDLNAGATRSRAWLMMRHLLWKDIRLIGPLLAAIEVGTLVFNWVAWMFMTSDSAGRNHADIAVMLWILMPNMMALGAPAILVGSEHESGTLNWTRSLPVSWKSFALSKAVVAIGVWLAAWLVSSLCLWWLLLGHSEPLSVVSADLLRGESQLRLLLFSSQLLLVGLIHSYWFKSPVASLLSLIPVVLLLSVSFNWLCRSDMTDASTQYSMKLMIGLGSITIAMLGILTSVAARRCMRSPARSVARAPRVSVQSQGRVSSRERFAFKRPSIRRALLWQAFRQQAWPLLGLSLLALVGLWGIYVDYRSWRPNPMTTWVMSSLGGLVFAANWLGCLCFYGDSVSRRRLFAADLGLSPGSFWWSRMAAPVSVLMLTMWCLSSMFEPAPSKNYAMALATPFVAFAAGQFAAMWVSRSALTFFVAPVLLSGLVIAVFPVLELFHNYYASFALAAMILFYATWRARERWMRGETQARFHAWMIGMLMLAPCLCYSSIVIRRYALTPALMPEWRDEMLAIPLPEAFSAVQQVRSNSDADYFRPWLETHGWESLRDEPALADYRWLDPSGPSDNELTGFHNYVNRFNRFWPPGLGPAKVLRVSELQLQWAKSARQAVLQGMVHPTSVLSLAERDEYSAISRLHQLQSDEERPISLKIREQLQIVAAQMASPELIRDSRRISLIMEWRMYQQQPPLAWKSFAGVMVDWVNLPRRIEAPRIDRYVDAATRETLAFLASNVTNPSYAQHNDAMHRTWDEVYDETFGPQPLPFNDATEYWRNKLQSNAH